MDHLGFLEKLVIELQPLTRKLKFNRHYAIDLRRVMLYVTLIELANSVCVMIRNRAYTGVRILGRSALEAYVDLVNLLKDPDYFDHLEATNLKDWLRTYKIAESGQNEYLACITSVPGLKEKVESEQAKLDGLIAAHKRPLNVYERFERAEMVSIYQSVYAMWSSETHNNQSGLVSRHIEFTEDNDFIVHLLKDNADPHLVSVLDGIAGCLIESSRSMHRAYGEGEDPIEPLDEELAMIRTGAPRKNEKLAHER